MEPVKILVFLIITLLIFSGCLGDDSSSDGNGNDPGVIIDDDRTDDGNTSKNDTGPGYPVHENITVTIFWIGEEAKEENGWVPNTRSAWDDKWMDHYGGIDDPDDRNGYHPAGFTPKQNPFYFSMPYNDFGNDGKRKTEVSDLIYWSGDPELGESDSMCKNRWIKITNGGKISYAQWEDTGPFWEDDGGYVFGGDRPKGEADGIAGLDVSPAVRDHLGLKNYDMVDWQFVDDQDVPDGPWKDIVTSMQTYWE